MAKRYVGNGTKGGIPSVNRKMKKKPKPHVATQKLKRR